MTNEILKIAIAEIGTEESPANSNKTKYGKWYGFDGFAWCAQFVSWVFDQAKLPLGHIDDDKGYRDCQSAYNFFLKNKWIITHPEPGDIVLYSWKNNHKQNHTGIFEAWIDEAKGTFSAIEGNTAVGDDSNGGKVMRRVRNKSAATFARKPK